MEQYFKTALQPIFHAARYSALAMLILIPVQIIIYVISPPPDSVTGFFLLFQQNSLLGLLSLDLLYLLNNVMIIVIYLALFLLLYEERPAVVLPALILGLIGNACYYPSNPAFEMLTLSHQFSNAMPGQQNIYLAAGEALMAGYTGTSFDVYYVLSTACLLLFSYALLKSSRFNKSLGLCGLISGFFMIIPSSAGVPGMIFSFLSLIPWVIFIALLVINLKKYTN